jgi:CHAD domain-containing protein
MVRDKKAPEPVLPRLRESLGLVAHEATPRNVHYFRTSCRRLASYADLAEGDGARALRKLGKKLGKVRKAAGRVRDLDVQIELLRDLQVENERDDRRLLLADLQDERDRAERKLGKQLYRETVQALNRKITKAQRADAPRMSDMRERRQRAWSEALELVAALPQDFPSVEQKNLHKLRLACKNVRYTAEQALPRAEARRLGATMKEVQDAIGRWHDWLMLRSRAEELLPEESILIRVLRSAERTSLAEALRRGRAIVRPHVGADEIPTFPRFERKEPQTSTPSATVANAS